MKNEIKLSDILKELMNQANTNKKLSEDTGKPLSERLEYLEKANGYLSKVNDLVPEEMKRKYFKQLTK